jgi:hypothetical protein
MPRAGTGSATKTTEDKMSRTFKTHKKYEKCTKNFVVKSEGNTLLGDVSVVEKIIIKWIIKIQVL